ncbi:MAG: TetR family transcriptional regulator [Isosphaeraceae bacterium]
MGEGVLTRDRILDAAVDVLRRFGPEKATVVDVARALGVTHGSVYRYFASKAALRDAVVQRWLEEMMPPLETVANGEGPAPERLRLWLDRLIAAKRSRATDDPELFAAYYALATRSRRVVQAHIESLVALAARIIADGVSDGEFAADDPVAAGRALLYATTRFHNPAHAAEWSDPDFDRILDDVWNLLIRGLASRSP